MRADCRAGTSIACATARMALALDGHGGSLRTDDFAVCDPGRLDDPGRAYRLDHSTLSGLAASSAAEKTPDELTGRSHSQLSDCLHARHSHRGSGDPRSL